jgi:ubiquinone/menaquinone biosynthesis C-methylase UbiE
VDSKLQKRVQRYGWDKAAAFYEGSWQAQLAPAQATLLELASLEPGANVLDVACGTGLVTFRGATLVAPGGSVIGTDISDEMVSAARAIACEKGIENVRFERMDAEDLQFDDESFDRVLCALGLMYVPDAEKAVCEIYRTLRPGGRAAAAVWGQRSKCGWAEIFPIVDARVQSEVCPMFFRLGTGQTLQQAFTSAGFRDVTVRRLETRLLYATQSDACEAVFIGGPVALAYSRFSDEVKAEARDEYLESIAHCRTAEGYDIPGEFVVVAATR